MYTNIQGIHKRLVLRDGKKVYMANQIVRMGVPSCFEELILNLQLNVVIAS